MFIAILIGLLCVTGLVLLFIARGIDATSSRSNADAKFSLKVAGVVGLVLGVALLGINSWHIVPPGERGIQTTLGSMNMEPLGEGFQWVNILSSVSDVSVQNRKLVQVHTAETIDTQTIKLQVAVNLRPLPNKITYLVKENGKNWEEVIVTSLIDDAVKAEVGLHKVTDVVKNRPLIKANLESSITERLAKYGIEVKEVNVTELDFSDEYDKAIEAKQVAEQDSQRMVNVLTKTKTEAEMAAAMAKGKADSKIEEARGEAESTLLAAKAKAQALEIEGAAQAAYNKKVAESLTPDLLHRLWIEKWAGTVPSTMLGGQNTQFLLPLPQSK